MIEEVEHHKEEEVEENHEEGEEEPCHVLFTGRCSDVARWATEWQIAKVVEDHEEGEVEEKEPIHSLVGRGGGRHEEEGWRGGILIRRSSMFVVNDNSKLSSIPLFDHLKLMLAQRTLSAGAQ